MKKEEIVSLLVVVFFIAGFILLFYFDKPQVTGFVIKDTDDLIGDKTVRKIERDRVILADETTEYVLRFGE